MANLNSQVQEIVRTFAEQIVEAVRGSSLQDLIGSASVGDARRSDTPKAFSSSSAARGAVADAIRARELKTARSNGRLRRRSGEEIQAMLDKVVGLVRKHKTGLRAEEIRADLGMRAKEMPRILKEGIMTKKLVTKGQKRATTYFAR